VTWDNGDSFDYYIGYDGKYQLNLANEQGIKDCFYYGEKVQIDKSLEHLAWQTADCATLTLTICSDNSRYHSIVFDNGYQNNYRYVDLQQCGNDDCADTNKGLTDKDGNGCEAYINSPSLCGTYDGNEGFVANQMCCACGGGKEIEGQTCQDSGNLDCAWVERKGKCGTYGHRCKKTCNLCDYEMMIGKWCGGAELIRFWDDGSNANFGGINDISNCEKICNMHVECAGFVRYNNMDGCYWHKGPLNPASHAMATCYKKLKV